jgi:predicted dienelactone hydrolase
LAAERLIVRFGPIQQSVAIADLQHFADTGDVPPGLRPYSALLTHGVRQALNSRLQLDPNIGDRLVSDLLQSSAGQRLLDALEVIITDSNVAEIQTALTLAARQLEGLSLISFLRAYPEETITIDGTAAIALASQMNLPYWQSQALSSILERELTVATTEPFQADFDPTAVGEYRVRQQTLTLRDSERDRMIPVDLYWSRQSQGPLVVISHGFGADRRFLGYLASHLASHGFTVAALEHPGSNVAWLTELTLGASQTGILGDILPATEFVDRPKDVSFLLDQLERMNYYSRLLRGKLNTKRVTVIGHSLGGYTALALAGAELNPPALRQFCAEIGPAGLSPADWLQCTAAELPDERVSLQDLRVVQIMALNPVTGHLFDAASLSKITIPTLILTGTDDAITPTVSQQLLPFSQLRSPKYLLTAIGGTHLSVGDPVNLNHALTESMFIRERRGEETEALRQLLRGVSLAFIKQLTPEADRYAPFLSSAYAQSFSTPDLKLRLNPELPPNLSNWLTMIALPLERLVSSTLQRHHRNHLEGVDGFTVSDLLRRLPLVMFILPGNLAVIGNPLLKLRRRSKWEEG